MFNVENKEQHQLLHSPKAIGEIRCKEDFNVAIDGILK